MTNAITRTVAGAIALSMGLSLAGCGGMPTNRTLYSVKQPVVKRTNYTLDVASGYDGLSIPEQQRVSGWFEAMDLRYGDRVSIDGSQTTPATRNAIAALAGRHGILLSDGAPVTTGEIPMGMTRIVITRSTASVPGCPDWSATSDANYNNATSRDYGCAVNSNLAAMVANPEDLIKGQDHMGDTVVMSSNKAIETYRNKANTGAGELKSAGATGGSGGSSGGGH
ncbi:CpaD family pilus assembly protein [Tsuneonella mangrovi]|uniref:CpaD family pilus assembly protein n=1 Tax=Tsuneonella mangrovi TaxID=1982042 RepID=UPI000BA1D708|nr:CpaD family pilus assembly protein [Tsuneonella mangrovi]